MPRVLTKFAWGEGLRLTPNVEVAPDSGPSTHKIEETKSALRELGLDEQLDLS
jgi:hypothetical protein